MFEEYSTYNALTCDRCIHKGVCAYKDGLTKARFAINEAIRGLDNPDVHHIFHVACVGIIACKKFKEE